MTTSFTKLRNELESRPGARSKKAKAASDVQKELTNKLYVLVRKDLTPGQQLAQVGHACAGFGMRYPGKVRETPVIVVLEIPSDLDLLLWVEQNMQDYPQYLFFDPDLGMMGEYTAVATVCDGTIFTDLHTAGASRWKRTMRWLDSKFTPVSTSKEGV